MGGSAGSDRCCLAHPHPHTHPHMHYIRTHARTYSTHKRLRTPIRTSACVVCRPPSGIHFFVPALITTHPARTCLEFGFICHWSTVTTTATTTSRTMNTTLFSTLALAAVAVASCVPSVTALASGEFCGNTTSTCPSATDCCASTYSPTKFGCLVQAGDLVNASAGCGDGLPADPGGNVCCKMGPENPPSTTLPNVLIIGEFMLLATFVCVEAATRLTRRWRDGGGCREHYSIAVLSHDDAVLCCAACRRFGVHRIHNDCLPPSWRSACRQSPGANV